MRFACAEKLTSTKIKLELFAKLSCALFVGAKVLN